jgi:hypothetical protein
MNFRNFMKEWFEAEGRIPDWVIEALDKAHIKLT